MPKRLVKRGVKRARPELRTAPSSTQDHIAVSEISFERVESEDLVACANWELHRELCRRDGELVPKPWLEMTPKERQSVGEIPRPGLFIIRPAVELPPPLLHGAKCVSEHGRELASAEVVELEMLVRWDQSDEKILTDMNHALRVWLRAQRASNPNALTFNPGRPGRGKRPEPITFLTRLAAWRLSTRTGISAAEIETSLRPLLRRTGQHGLSGNLARWCKTIDDLLRK